ncbi:MAG: preprotein translocase subunit SecE [Planctomycetota bacterium]
MFHLWPQGRIVRIAVLALAGIMALDLIFHGAYGNFATWSLPSTGGDNKQPYAQLVQGILNSVLALTILTIGFLAAGPHKRAVEFLIDVEDEMHKVEWPKPGDLWRRTIIVAIAIALISLVVFLTDYVLFQGLEFIQKR